MSAEPKRPLNRDRAWAYILLNLSIPGWGSWKAGRKVAGIGELVIVIAGLLLIGIWMLDWMNRIFQSQLGDSLPPVPANWLWQSGVACCVVSWIWTIVTGVSLMQEAKANEAENRLNVPPRLDDIPKPPKLN